MSDSEESNIIDVPVDNLHTDLSVTLKGSIAAFDSKNSMDSSRRPSLPKCLASRRQSVSRQVRKEIDQLVPEPLIS